MAELENPNKVIKFEVEDGKLKLTVDPNRDGEPVVYLLVDVREVPDEVADLFAKKDKPADDAA